jgi:cellulose synthase/poly-beta-1,6-N-acetylglucosamine synthase-like glycosyltransferase
MIKRKILQNQSVAVLVPAYNEESVLADTLKSILKIVTPNNLYVVNDGSKDKTFEITQMYTKNVYSTQNRGKAHALNIGIKYFNLTKKYKYIFFMDADTKPEANFLKKALVHFENDRYKKIVCVVGRVKGYGINWVTKYRQWEYQISHFIHKRAQENINSILVVPGCATVYRSFIFEKLNFPSGTLTEDMDFTFLLHRSGYNKMVFENDAVVYTQDPQNIHDFIKQLSRWYTGFWQVVRKHDVPWQGQALDLEASLLALEGLYNGLVVLFLIISAVPLAILGRLNVFIIPFAVDFLLFFIPTLIWSSISDKDYTRILYIPHFYFLRFLSSSIFLTSFFRGFLSLEKEYIWDSKRYIQGREGV